MITGKHYVLNSLGKKVGKGFSTRPAAVKEARRLNGLYMTLAHRASDERL